MGRQGDGGLRRPTAYRHLPTASSSKCWMIGIAVFRRRRLAGGDAHQVAHRAEAFVAAEGEHEEFAHEAPIDETDSRDQRCDDQLHNAPCGKLPVKIDISAANSTPIALSNDPGKADIIDQLHPASGR